MKSILALIAFVISSSAICQDQYSIVFLHKKSDAAQISDDEKKKIFDGHMANMDRLAKENKLIAAGPFEGGGGFFVMKTGDVAQAKEWTKDDPGIIAKRWNVEILPFTPRHGNICKAPEPYEMVHYSFIRFNVVVSKFNATDFPQIVQKHNDYLKQITQTGNVLIDGTFSERDGGVIIMKGEVQKEVFEADPGVQEGLIELEIKKLFIAKGSFCEK